LSNVFTDATALFAHIVGPRFVERRLPPPARFGLASPARPIAPDNGRASSADSLWTTNVAAVDALKSVSSRTFAVISTEFPHHPWTVLPTGQAHSGRGIVQPGQPLGAWHDDPQPIRTAYQNHLAQVGAVDTLVGRMLDTMSEAGTLDASMIVVVADHGVAFRPNEPFRDPPERTVLAEIASVPFFVKFPDQRDGRVEDRPVEITDLAPTIYDVIGADPTRTDGRSLRDPSNPRERAVHGWGWSPVEIPDRIGPLVRKAAARKASFLNMPVAPKGAVETFYAVGPFADRVGKRVTSFRVGSRSRLEVELVDADAYERVDPDAPWLPAAVTAVVESGSSDLPIVIAVNERVAAMVEIVEDHDMRRIDSIFWPGFLHAGRNSIDLFEFDDGVLRPIRTI
jgi:hypothetical protein